MKLDDKMVYAKEFSKGTNNAEATQEVCITNDSIRHCSVGDLIVYEDGDYGEIINISKNNITIKPIKTMSRIHGAYLPDITIGYTFAVQKSKEAFYEMVNGWRLKFEGKLPDRKENNQKVIINIFDFKNPYVSLTWTLIAFALSVAAFTITMINRFST